MHSNHSVGVPVLKLCNVAELATSSDKTLSPDWQNWLSAVPHRSLAYSCPVINSIRRAWPLDRTNLIRANKSRPINIVTDELAMDTVAILSVLQVGSQAIWIQP